MTGAVREMGLETYSESMYPLHHFGWSDVRSMRLGRFKVFDAPRPELYDLERDPHEAHNLFDNRKARNHKRLLCRVAPPGPDVLGNCGTRRYVARTHVFAQRRE